MTFIQVYIHYLHPSMADKAILATLPKLNGSNWFEWKKEAETFLLLAGLDRVIDAEEVPTGAKAATDWTTKDRKMYAYLFFLIEPNYRGLLSTSNPVAKLGKSLLPSMKRTVPQHAWRFANNSIHSRTTPLSVSRCLLMPFFRSFDNSPLLVTKPMTSKLVTSS